MDIKEVERQFELLLDKYYSRLERIENWADVSDKEMTVLDKMEAVLKVMHDRLVEAGILLADNDNSVDVDNNNIKECEVNMKHAYNGNDRTDKLVARFFDLLENDGEWNELFLIRDLLIEETIYNGYSVIGMLQIDDILEEDLERFLDRFNIVNNYEVEELEKKVFSALLDKDVERSIELINEYGDNANNHPYVYYCAAFCVAFECLQRSSSPCYYAAANTRLYRNVLVRRYSLRAANSCRK